MTETVKVFVGNQPRMWRAYAVLKYTIEKFSSLPVHVEEMSHDTSNPMWHDWNMGRELGVPATRSLGPNGEAVWFTDFTNYRWAIPEACNFEGRAIYMDQDVILFDDIKELWEMDMGGKAMLTYTSNETSVMLIDCTKFKNDWWPSVANMKTNGHNISYYLNLLREKDFFGQLPTRWNCLDGRSNSYIPDYTKLVHYTDMSGQIWRPYPELLRYHRHQVPILETVWVDFYDEAMAAGYIPEEAPELGRLPEGVPDAFLAWLDLYRKENP